MTFAPGRPKTCISPRQRRTICRPSPTPPTGEGSYAARISPGRNDRVHGTSRGSSRAVIDGSRGRAGTGTVAVADEGGNPCLEVLGDAADAVRRSPVPTTRCIASAVRATYLRCEPTRPYRHPTSGITRPSETPPPTGTWDALSPHTVRIQRTGCRSRRRRSGGGHSNPRARSAGSRPVARRDWQSSNC